MAKFNLIKLNFAYAEIVFSFFPSLISGILTFGIREQVANH